MSLLGRWSTLPPLMVEKHRQLMTIQASDCDSGTGIGLLVAWGFSDFTFSRGSRPSIWHLISSRLMS